MIMFRRQQSKFHLTFLCLCFILSGLLMFQASNLLRHDSSDMYATTTTTNNNNGGKKDYFTTQHQPLLINGKLTGSAANNAIFYNIYIPQETLGSLEAVRIVREQMMERKSQAMALATPIYYTLIGGGAAAATPDTDATTTTSSTTETNAVAKAIEQIHKAVCNDDNDGTTSTTTTKKTTNNCHLLQHVESGEEVLTLQSLYDYCTDHPDATVTYLHNKGSLHPTPQNKHLRRLTTKSIFTPECQTMMQQEQQQHPQGTTINSIENNDNNHSSQQQCNICGARFSPFPHYHMPGNMWTAKCSYVSRLLPPNQFSNEMDALMDYVYSATPPSQQQQQQLGLDHIPRPTLQQIEEGYYIGLKRFSNEHWIGSHPFLQPCDVYPNEEYLSGYINVPKDNNNNNNNLSWKIDLQRAPRFPVSVFEKRAAFGEWFCGQARIVEFQFLYGRIPIPDTSFIWTFYNEAFKTCTEPFTKTTTKTIQGPQGHDQQQVEENLVLPS